MLDDTRGQTFDALASKQQPSKALEHSVPKHHSADPFACPCCANVFAETLRLANIDLAAQAKRTPARADRLAPPPMLVTGAHIITMNVAAPVAEALLVEAGRIAWVGKIEDAPAAAQGVSRLDLKGKVVVPGFVEPHMHLPPLAMMHEFSNIGPNRFETTAAALAQLGEVAAVTPVGEWVVGRQFDPSLQQGPDYLTRDLLDAVSSDHPVFVYNASLHLGYCNSVALELAGIDASTPDPQGAELGRDGQGIPNGVLKAGPAMALVVRHNTKLKNGNIAEGCL
ncbi:MAG: amidohydrolase family protein, partial [Pseudomonadales bacterium]|nr:amidohydrolase family protein [Pseudomonadales bacterium]